MEFGRIALDVYTQRQLTQEHIVSGVVNGLSMLPYVGTPIDVADAINEVRQGIYFIPLESVR